MRININIIALISSIIMVLALLFNTFVNKSLILNIQIAKNEETLVIDKKSLIELREIINQNNSVLSNDTLLKALEDQKNYYNFVITVFAAMLAIAGLFSFFRGLIEKEEKIQLDETLNSAKNELLNLKADKSKNTLIEKTGFLEKRFRLINIHDNSEVKNKEDFRKWVKRVVIEALKEVIEIGKEEAIIESTVLPNFILYSIDYAKDTYYKGEEPLKVNKEITDLLVDACQSVLDREKYDQLKVFVNSSFTSKFFLDSFNRY